MNTYLISYVINYTTKDHTYGNYIHYCNKLDSEELITKVGEFIKSNYTANSFGIINIIKMNY